MAACPVNKGGRHHLALVIPGDDGGDMTAVCENCGAMRRVPANGALPAQPLDEASVFAQADAIFGRGEWEQR